MRGISSAHNKSVPSYSPGIEMIHPIRWLVFCRTAFTSAVKCSTEMSSDLELESLLADAANDEMTSVLSLSTTAMLTRDCDQFITPKKRRGRPPLNPDSGQQESTWSADMVETLMTEKTDRAPFFSKARNNDEVQTLLDTSNFGSKHSLQNKVFHKAGW